MKNNHQVDVWLLDCNQLSGKQAPYYQLLSEQEQQRANRLIKPEHQQRFTVIHGALREILASYLAIQPEEIDFFQGEHGKPYLAEHHQTALQFNLSDSHEKALLAVSATKIVGVDIEWINQRIGVLSIAERFFSINEYQALQALPEQQQIAAFYRIWTRKEAYIKLIGQGLHFPLGDFDVSLEDKVEEALLSVQGSDVLAKQWSVKSLTIDEKYMAALAVDGDFCHVEHHDYFE